MKKIYSLLLAGFLCPLFSLAQSNYKPGYVVNLKGDTLKGEIDYREWSKTPKTIIFKNNTGKTETFSAKSSGGFGIRGLEYYRSFVLHVSQDEVGISNAQSLSDTTTIIDTVYLRLLTTGPRVELYNYQDDIKNRFYMAEGNATPQELIFRSYYKPEESTSVQYNNRFHVQLQNIVQKYAINTTASDKLVENAEYNKRDLIKVAQFINNNKLQIGVSNQMGTRFFAGIAVDHNNLKFKGDNVFANQSGNYTFPEITAGVDLFLNKVTQALFFRLAVSYTADKYAFSASSPSSVYSITKVSTLSFKRNIISVNPQVGYNFYNTESLKAFVNLGISIRHSIYNDYKTIETYGNISTNTKDKDPEFNHFAIILPTVKAGVSIHKQIELFVGYLPSTGINAANGFTVKITTYQAGINYLFK
ncbi:MAG: hypothetical protein JWR38_682 [Mucilaginibacter sp.]|nr:hypothetical protein [Mucilaginibacter sp.]